MRVGIVGGGITGLALVHALARRGIDAILFEAEPRPGGLIRTRRLEGRVLELGPQRTRLAGPVRRLVEELGLTGRLRLAAEGARLHIWARGRLRAVPTGPWGLVAGDLLPPAARFRVLAEPLTAGLAEEESVADYFRRKAGREAYRVLFGPLVSATYAADPAEMPAGRVLPPILEALGVRRSLVAATLRWRGAPGAPACTFEEGMETLPAALAERHVDRIATATPVRAIEPAETGIALRVGEGATPAVEVVDRAVLTVPARAAARLLAGAAPRAAAALEGLTYHEVAIVHLDVASTPDGFGFQVAFGEPWRTRGVTWNASLFGRERLATAYLGGGLDPAVVGWPEERVGRVAAEEYASIHGVAARPLGVWRAELPAWDRSWAALDRLELPRGVVLAAGYTGRLGISARIAEAERIAERLAGGR